MTLHGRAGQSLVELAVVLPLMLLIVLGGYTLCRGAFLRSSCGSLAQAITLRAGRSRALPDPMVRRIVPPDTDNASWRTVTEKAGASLPVPLPGVAGRTTSEIRLEKRWKEAGDFTPVMSTSIVRSATAHVDCWGAGSPSGKKIRTFVGATVGLGFLQ